MLYALFFRAGKPPPGLHLDVVKGDKLIEVWKCMSLLFSHHTKDFASDSLFHPLSYALFSSNATFVHPEFFFLLKAHGDITHSDLLFPTDTQFFVTSLTFQMKGLIDHGPVGPNQTGSPITWWIPSLSTWSCVEGARFAVTEEESEWCRSSLTFKLLLWYSGSSPLKMIVN